jgi:ribosomal protein S28E/S33
MNRIGLTAVLALLALACGGSAALGQETVRTTLERLQTDELWGEITLQAGGVRQVRIESLAGDEVVVREVVGPLQARHAVYELAAIRSAREIGVHRIPRRVAPYRAVKSPTLALAIEVVLPGFGYFYAGETRQGYAQLGVSAAAVATALATGEDGGAGWIPFVAWTKVAALLHLRDEVRAANAVHRERAAGLADRRTRDPRAARIPIAAIHMRF